MKKLLEIVLVCAVVLISCTYNTTIDPSTPSGSNATLTLQNWEELNVELLALSGDSLIYVVENGELAKVGLSVLRQIYVLGYTVDPGIRINAAILPLLVDVVGVYLLWFEVYPRMPLLAGLAVVVTGATAYGFFGGVPKIVFTPPLKEKHLEKLKLYCRYPQGLTDEQWRELLRHYHQQDFVPLIGSRTD